MDAKHDIEDIEEYHPISFLHSGVGDFGLIIGRSKGTFLLLYFQAHKRVWSKSEYSLPQRVFDSMKDIDQLFSKEYIFNSIFNGKWK